MKLLTNQSLSADNKAVAGDERQIQTTSLATTEITRVVFAALKAFGVFQPEVKVTAELLNSLQGKMKTQIKAYVSNGLVSFGMEVPVDSGKVGITEPMVAQAFNAAVRAFNETPAVFETSNPDKMAIDLKKIKAERKGDLVIYSTEELPLWSMFVEVEALKSVVNHSLIATSIISHLRGYVLADYARVADFSKEPFGLPVVTENNVQAALKPAETGYADVPQTAYEVDQQIALMNLQARTKPNSDLAHPVADDRLYAERQRVHLQAEHPVRNFIAKLGGASPKIVAVDFSQSKLGIAGNLQGALVVQATYYSATGLETIGLKLPLDERSLVIADKIEKTKMTLEAEQKKAADLKILSEAEAKQKFAEFKAQREQDFSAALQSGMAIKADTGELGGNLFNRPPLARIPVLRAMLPLSANTAGKTIELGGYVYKLYPTNYNTVGTIDPEDSPFLMLCLTDEMPNGKADAYSIYGGMKELVG
jgi:hypothetical protein